MATALRSRVADDVPVVGREFGPGSGLRVRPHRPARALLAGLLMVGSVLAALTIYAKVGERRQVLAVTRTVLAGQQLTDADFRVVSIATDDVFAAVTVAQRAGLVGQYAKVRLVAGSLLVSDSLQSRPLVDPAKVLMSVSIAATGVPTGLREGSRLVLVVTPKGDSVAVLIEAVVAAIPGDLAQRTGGGASSTSAVALSVEVSPDAVAVIGTASKVAVGVLDPSATFPGGGVVAAAAPPAAVVPVAVTP